MKLSRIKVLAVMPVLALGSCGDDDVDVREGPSGMLADSAVLEAMRSADTPYRIVYDAPPDLSLSSARQRRPDIFRPPPRPGTVAQKDTTKPDTAPPRAPRP